jgi:hypothetical protein
MHTHPRLSVAALILVVMSLGACEGARIPNPLDFQPGFTPITTEEEFRAQVIGREVVYADGAVGSYGADGTWAIRDEGGVRAQGTWQWSGDRWCRQGISAEGPVEPACEGIAISEQGIRFTREDGSEETLPFRA